MQALELKALSKAMHVTADTPSLNRDPLGGTHDVLSIPEPSVADAPVS